MEKRTNKQSNVDVSEVSSEEESLKQRPILKRHASAQAVIRTDDWWLWEVAGILISLAALVGIGALLSVLADRPQPTWAYTTPTTKIGSKTIPARTVAVSPNALLSLLSTIARICVLIPITKGLAQLKWVWFAEQERVLSDFEAFDNATRGVTGSLFLIWRFKFRHFAVVGASAVLLALAFDPFVQNLLSYYNKNIEDPSIPAQLPRATLYGGAASGTPLAVSMKSAIIAGFSSAPNYNIPNYYCGSGNCTWKDTPTLGVCSRCSDVSSLLVRQCNQTNISATGDMHKCRFSLPNGFHLNAFPDTSTNIVVNVTMNDHWSYGYEALRTANYTNPIARTWAIFADGNDVDDYTTYIKTQTKMYATECALIPCVQLYDSSVGSSGLTTAFNDKVTQEFDVYTHGKKGPYLAGGGVDNTGGSFLEPHEAVFGLDTYHMSATVMFQTTSFLLDTLPGTVQTTIEAGGAPFFTLPDSYSAYADSLFLQNVFTTDPAKTCNKDLHSGNWEALRFQCAIENIARAMTVDIRGAANATIGPTAPTEDGFEKSPLISLGKTMTSTTFIAVTWYWLLLPIVLWFLACIMLVGTFMKTRQAGVRTWRTSTLAPLFLGLGIGDEQKQKVEHLPLTADGLQKKAEEIKVQLHLTGDGAKMVGE